MDLRCVRLRISVPTFIVIRLICISNKACVVVYVSVMVPLKDVINSYCSIISNNFAVRQPMYVFA